MLDRDQPCLVLSGGKEALEFLEPVLNEDHFSDWRGFLDFTYPLWKAMTTWMT